MLCNIPIEVHAARVGKGWCGMAQPLEMPHQYAALLVDTVYLRGQEGPQAAGMCDQCMHERCLTSVDNDAPGLQACTCSQPVLAAHDPGQSKKGSK
eukprot:1133671-Pelagomonas_calceolata.AAC.12